MRIGVYIDGYNLYYGGRGLCGRSTPGWRWLDLNALASDLIASHSRWHHATVATITYCTARVSGASNPAGQREQDVYLRALERSCSFMQICYPTPELPQRRWRQWGATESRSSLIPSGH